MTKIVYVPYKKPKAIVYPASDGKPLAETDIHLFEVVSLFFLLKDYFSKRNDVYVASNNFIYYTEGNIKDRFSPDIYVVFGIPSHMRRTYNIWEEGKPPSVVFELTSRKTKAKDLGPKKELCERLGVREYFLHDPEADYLKPPLQGFRLNEGRYCPINVDESGAIVSETLGVKLCLEGKRLALFNAATGERIWRTEDARKRAEAEAEQANAEIARLREENERLKNR